MKNFMPIDQQFRWNEQILWKVQIAKSHSQENVCSEKHCTSKENEFAVKKTSPQENSRSKWLHWWF